MERYNTPTYVPPIGALLPKSTKKDERLNVEVHVLGKRESDRGYRYGNQAGTGY